MQALAWEFWSANRRGWLIVLGLLVACGLPYRLFVTSFHDSEGMRFFAFLPLTAAVILAISFCNFTDRNRRDGIAGFPRHLFTLPISVGASVTCAMLFSLLSVVGIYVAWSMLVLKALETDIPIRWPATLLAAFVVFYQAIIWCLCGFRLTRVIGLSLVATMLVAVGFMPTLLPAASFWASEAHLTAALALLMIVAYAATLVTVSAQRRGGARGWAGIQMHVERLARAIPHPQFALKSPDTALFWMEWRRAGFVLPLAVLLMVSLILGPVLSFTGRGDKETFWAEMWIAMMPIILAFPIGLGFGKPDFWSLELSLSPFASVRPVTAGQLLAAKMKAAACSALLAWAVVLVVAPICIYLWCDSVHWRHLWYMLTQLYFPASRLLVPILALAGAVLLTWSLLVANLWVGFSGRAGFYYTITGIGLAAFLTGFFYFVWWLDHPRSHGDSSIGMLPWLPWVLAALVSVKVWMATLCVLKLRRADLVSYHSIVVCAYVFLAAIVCVLLFACLMSPRFEWFRNIAILAGIFAIPAVSIAVAPFTIAWNRHR